MDLFVREKRAVGYKYDTGVHLLTQLRPFPCPRGAQRRDADSHRRAEVAREETA